MIVGWEISHGGSDVELDEKRMHLEESSRDGGVLGALEEEAERAQIDAKAAKHRAQEARGFASAKSRSRIQRDEQEGVTLEREMLAVKIERERAYSAIQDESKAKKRAAEVQKEAVLRRKIAGLEVQSAQFRQQAETFK